MNSKIIFEAVRKCTFRVVLSDSDIDFVVLRHGLLWLSSVPSERCLLLKGYGREVFRRLFVHSLDYTTCCMNLGKRRTLSSSIPER